MTRRKIFCTLALFLLVYACEESGDIKKDPGKSNPDAETILHDGETREYILHVPDSYDGTSELPLLFNFHGFGGIASEYMNEADMRPLAESENFILVYPQGTLLDGFPHWNAALATPDNKSDVDDLGFMEVLIEELSANYKIDSERIYACGYSNGAFFSYALACYMSDKIAAIGSVSGTMLDISATCTPSHPTAMINFHGTLDKVIPYEGSAESIAIEQVLDYWTGFNNTQTTPSLDTEEDGGVLIEHYVFPQGDAGVSVEHFKLIGGDHVWFDMNYQGSNTGKLLWDFLSKYDIQGLR